MVAFVGVAWLEDLPPGRAMTVTIGDQKVALVNVGGTVHAIDDACLHAGLSLGEGALHVFGFEAHRDVLRAVPVEGVHVDRHDAFGARLAR